VIDTRGKRDGVNSDLEAGTSSLFYWSLPYVYALCCHDHNMIGVLHKSECVYATSTVQHRKLTTAVDFFFEIQL